MVQVGTRFTLCFRVDLWVDKEKHGENKSGGGMKRPVKIYLRRENCTSCERRVGAKINIWMEKKKYDMLSTQLSETQKRRSLLVLKTIKKTYFVLRTENQEVIKEKCIQGDNGNLSLDDTSKKLAWKHYERLLKTELLWSQNLRHVDPVAGPVKFIT